MKPRDKAVRKTVEIEFLYLDKSVCTRCRETERILLETLGEARESIRAAGTTIRLRRLHVRSEEEARRLGFVTSPTIRINGRDLQPRAKMTLCESCGDLCGIGGITCRVWSYKGKEYPAPPKAMLIDEIRRETAVSGGKARSAMPTEGNLPINLKRFFDGKKRRCAAPDCCPDR